jgi:hypothetical protein
MTITPPTLAQWREWAKTATRNWTDALIGEMTDGKRQADAMASDVFTDGDSPIPVFDKTDTDKEGKAA